MTTVLLVVLAAVTLLLVPVTFVQMLYLDSLRLRTRERPALTLFKEQLEDRIGLKTERGSFVYSLLKHSLLGLLGVLSLGVAAAFGPVHGWALLQACALTFLLMLVAAYIVPQLLYRRTSGHWVVPVLPLIGVLTLLMRPVTGLLTFLQSLAEVNEAKAEEEEAASTPEDLDALIDAGAEEGLIEEEDRKLIQSAVAFNDKTVREVMTPRPSIVAIQADRTLDELRQLAIHEQYSRIPVLGSSIDQVLGFIHVRDMFELEAEQRRTRTVRELIRKIEVVPETKPVSDLLREMQENGTHMVIVVDEYGNTAGLATMEDLVEELVGEIRDEHEPMVDVKVDADGCFVVAGSYDLDHLEELLEFRPHDETESTTVGGLITEWLGHVPQPGEQVERDGIRIEVLAGNELRVEQVRIARVERTRHAEKA